MRDRIPAQPLWQLKSSGCSHCSACWVTRSPFVRPLLPWWTCSVMSYRWQEQGSLLPHAMREEKEGPRQTVACEEAPQWTGCLSQALAPSLPWKHQGLTLHFPSVATEHSHSKQSGLIRASTISRFQESEVWLWFSWVQVEGCSQEGSQGCCVIWGSTREGFAFKLTWLLAVSCGLSDWGPLLTMVSC